MKTWINLPKDTDFTIHNLPFGIFSTEHRRKRVGIAIGDQIIDLLKCAELGLFDDFLIYEETFNTSSLNNFISLGKHKWSLIRRYFIKALTDPNSKLKKNKDIILVAQANASMHLPVDIRDYTDFYSSIEHATNVGKMFRDPENALLPNWRHIPVAYHGRASSIIVSGDSVYRPKGQYKPLNHTSPIYGSSLRLDFELETAFIVGKNTTLGESITTINAEDHIFGMVLFNDWSARDIQKWEYVPLGPFLSKNFASSISPWVITTEALEPFRTKGPEQNPEVLPYLKFQGDKNYDIKLDVYLQPHNEEEQLISSSNFKYMYWNMAQQLAHHTVNGCNVNIGDMMGSGTISGQDKNSYGSMLELTWGGKHPIRLKNGITRTFIEDNDTIVFRGKCEKEGVSLGFGEVRTKILASI
ncbi:fumarylacetoacetase [Aquimarina aquimarini]|uniref:fumarylacetoacetase n=1 Tax=Aquimarina aquimarini TaxID=1191734 RepID=UPI000D56088C|nr:fumarylacetoacetase [Aquimarina aquimarini]